MFFRILVPAMAQSFDQLADTVLEMSLNKQELDELMEREDDPTPTIVPDTKGPVVPVQAVGTTKFKPKHVICGPDRAQHAPSQPRSIMTRGRAAAQARLTRRDRPYSPGRRISQQPHQYPPRPCPPPTPFSVPPPPIVAPSTNPVGPKPIAPLVIIARPKLTQYMIETLSSSLINQCKMGAGLSPIGSKAYRV